MKIVFIAILGCILLTSCASKDKQVRSKQAELYFGAGTQSLIDQQYTEALTSLIKANELDPNNSEIINNLAMAYYFKGEEDMAVKHLHKSLELNESNSDAKVNLASIYYKKEEIKKAEDLYKEVLKDLTYDKQARTLYNLGLLEFQKKNNLVSAENYFKKSIKEDDNYCPAYFQLGMIQFQRHQYNLAFNNFKEAGMGTCYDSASAHYHQALTLVELHRFDEARMKFDEIDTRFKKSVFAVKARQKIIELNDIEAQYRLNDSHASRKVLESPDF